MNALDDAGLREQLDRRVRSSPLGHNEREEILGAVASARTASRRANLWSGGRWLGLAAAALSVILVAVIVFKLPPTVPPAATSPATPLPSPGNLLPPETSGPRIFSAQELSDMIGGPRVGDVVLANARVRDMRRTDQKGCGPPGPCREAVLEDVSGPNVVAMGWRPSDEGEGTLEEDDSGFRWITRVTLPAESGLFAFRVLEDAVEYLGPVLRKEDGGILRSVEDIEAGEHSHASNVVFPVQGWLVADYYPYVCPGPPDDQLDRTWYCGVSLLTPDSVRTIDRVGERIEPATLDGLVVPRDAYDRFAVDPASDELGTVPRKGVYLVRSAGCDIALAPCPAWSMVGRLDDLSAEPTPPMTSTPIATVTAPPVAIDGFPSEIDGEPVLNVEQAQARVISSETADQFLVGGWLTLSLADCFVPPDFPDTPLLAPCGDGFHLISEEPNRDSTGLEGLRLVVASDTNLFQVGPEPTVLRVHAHDSRAAECPIGYRVRCERAIVVDEVVWSENPPPPLATPAVIDLPPLAIGNGTTLPVFVAVNGKRRGTCAAWPSHRPNRSSTTS